MSDAYRYPTPAEQRQQMEQITSVLEMAGAMPPSPEIPPDSLNALAARLLEIDPDFAHLSPAAAVSRLNKCLRVTPHKAGIRGIRNHVAVKKTLFEEMRSYFLNAHGPEWPNLPDMVERVNIELKPKFQGAPSDQPSLDKMLTSANGGERMSFGKLREEAFRSACLEDPGCFDFWSRESMLRR